MVKERHIRLARYGKITYPVCKHILLDADPALEGEGEYETHFAIKCRVCKRVYHFVEHMN